MAGVLGWSTFLEDSDIHGLKQLGREGNGKVRRAVWAILLVASLGVLIGVTVKQLTLFYSYEHVTKFDVNFVHKLEFPAITICNMNRLRRSALTLEDIAVMGPYLGITDDNLTLHHPQIYPQDWFNDTFRSEEWQMLKNTSNVDDGFDVADFYNRTGHELEDLVPACLWKGAKCNDSSWTIVYTHYGKCYTFNKNGDHSLSKAGSGNALKLTLYDDEADYVHTEGSTHDRGMKIMIHSVASPPYPKELGSGFAPGYHHLIALTEKQVLSLPQPYGDCGTADSTKYYSDYSISACKISCETELIYERCNCRLVESPADYPVCSVDLLFCATDVLKSIEGTEECLCHNPCDATVYSYQHSMLTLRNSSVEKLKKEYAIPENVTRNSLMVVNIYFDSLAYESVEQLPAYTLLSVASDFGGTLGLLLGASVLAVVQFVDFLIAGFYQRYNRPTRSKDTVQYTCSSEGAQANATC